MDSYEGSYRPPRGTPFGEAFHKMEREIRDKATEEEVDWLEDHPIMWLRALSWYERVLQSHTGMERMHLDKLKPLPDTNPSIEFLKAKRSLRRNRQVRHHIQELIYMTREEVKSMIDSDDLASIMTSGDLLEFAVQIRDMAKLDDFAGIEKSCHGIIGKIQRKAKERDAAGEDREAAEGR